MEALTWSLSTKIFTRNAYKTPSPSSTFALLDRFDIGFSRSPASRRLHFHDLLLSAGVAKSRVASDAAEVSTALENAVAGIPKIKTSETIHVKFQLQKPCTFGDQFLLVGDDPMLGLWNPAHAIPMTWSDGHIWNVELDLPIDSTIQFKFILKQPSGEILWQPGPDRIFKSWESGARIVIAEDWENSEAQKITEEQVELVINPDLEIHSAGGNVTNQSEQSLHSAKSSVMFPDNVNSAEENLKQELARKTSSTTLTPGSRAMTVEDEENLRIHGEGNVLVPGVASQSTERPRTNERGSIVDDSSFGAAKGPHSELL